MGLQACETTLWLYIHLNIPKECIEAIAADNKSDSWDDPKSDVELEKQCGVTGHVHSMTRRFRKAHAGLPSLLT